MDNERGVTRSADEVRSRISAIETAIRENTFFLHRGLDKVPEPTSEKILDQLHAKLNEFKWLLGEEIEINEGVH